MFKRANKITALLVAAASMMSVVPAMASDYKKVDSQDGVVYGAVAYKDGTAVIDGTVDGNDGVYYLENGKYTALDSIDSGSKLSSYGTKYAKVDDGADYNVDLSNGTVITEDQPTNDFDDAASALRKKAKTVDRYGNDTTTIAVLNAVQGNKFGDAWYETTSYILDSAKYAGNSANPVIYTDKDGNYIDADYSLGKIKVGTTAAGADTVTVENTVDKYKVATTDDTYARVGAQVTLGQDADYIYRYAEITVTSTADANGQIVVNNKAFNVTTGGPSISSTVVVPVVQKISKAQASDNIEEAKYAKTVYNYIIGDDGGKVDNTAKAFIAAADGANVISGKLAAYSVTEANSDDNVKVQAMTLKQKNGYYYTDLEDLTKGTAQYSTDIDKTAFGTDVDGNIYILDSGYVKEFDGTSDWNKVYKVDGSFDSLSVYDKDNMVAWNQGDEIYSVIGGKTTDTTTPVVTTPVVTAGWAQAANGTWTYNKADGTKATGWLLDGATWYYLKADGVMAKGWVQDGATWYYTNASGAMQTGWINDNGTWYYTNASGAMLANTTVDGYVLGASGAWVK